MKFLKFLFLLLLMELTITLPLCFDRNCVVPCHGNVRAWFFSLSIYLLHKLLTIITRFPNSFVIPFLLKIYALKKLYFTASFKQIINVTKNSILHVVRFLDTPLSVYAFGFFYVGAQYKGLCLFLFLQNCWDREKEALEVN